MLSILLPGRYCWVVIPQTVKTVVAVDEVVYLIIYFYLLIFCCCVLLLLPVSDEVRDDDYAAEARNKLSQ